MSVPTALEAEPLGPPAVGNVDSSAQAAAGLALGRHLRDAVKRADAAGPAPIDAPGGLLVAGAGSAAAGAQLAIGMLGDRLRRPMIVVDGSEIPAWAGPANLVLCSSYSGLTEQTLACYAQARRQGAPILVASAGGALTARARADGVPVIELPGGLRSRTAIGYFIVCALTAAALVGAAPDLRAELEDAAALLDGLAVDWGPAGEHGSAAKALARRLLGLAPVIVGTGPAAAVAWRWKCQLNANAKVPAFWSALPADHDDISGWASAADIGASAAAARPGCSGSCRSCCSAISCRCTLPCCAPSLHANLTLSGPAVSARNGGQQ